MYSLLKVPSFAVKDFFSFTKEEAKQYFKWFLQVKDERMQILRSHVQQEYPEWKSDYTRDSLIILYEWFRDQVRYRPMTEDEKEQVRQQINATPLLANVVSIPETTFTEETVSICFDIGVYWGDSLILNVPEVKWIQKTTSPNYIDYAQPLVAKHTSKVPINPRRVAESLAQRILDRDTIEITLVELFDKWVVKFST